MVVENGYKQTDIGVIPEDWEVKTLGEIGDVIIGLTYSPNDVREFGTLVLRSSNIQNNQLAFENNVFVDMDLPSRVIVKEDDLLICVRNGSKNLIGKCALINKKAAGSAFGAFMSIYRSSSNKYVLHQFQSNSIQRQINERMGATINQITNKDLSGFVISFPPLHEQTAIANALSDMDALIAQTEKLIEKKKAIKQGVMQELLKPKDGWGTKKLGEVGTCLRGVSYNPDTDLDLTENENNLSLLRSNNIQDGLIDQNNLQYVKSHIVKEFQVIKDLDIIICMANGSKQLVGKAAITNNIKSKRYTYGAFMGCFRVNSNNNPHFIFALMESKQYRDYIDVSLAGSSINNLNPGAIESMSFPMPEKSVQDQIAGLVGDLQESIIMLQRKLQKLKQQKQGMMQALLTGKIRLV